MSIPAPPKEWVHKQLRYNLIEVDHDKLRKNEELHLSGNKYQYQPFVTILHSTNSLHDAIVFMQGVVTKLQENKQKQDKILVNEHTVQIFDRSKGWFTKENKLIYTYYINERLDLA